jgi:hypothetical protein
MASPLAKSGLAALAAGPAARAEPATKAADRAVTKREKIDFMAWSKSWRKTQGFYNEVRVSFLTTQGIPDL